MLRIPAWTTSPGRGTREPLRSLSFALVHARSRSFTLVLARSLSFTLVHSRSLSFSLVPSRARSPAPVRPRLLSAALGRSRASARLVCVRVQSPPDGGPGRIGRIIGRIDRYVKAMLVNVDHQESRCKGRIAISAEQRRPDSAGQLQPAPVISATTLAPLCRHHPSSSLPKPSQKNAEDMSASLLSSGYRIWQPGVE